jgi:hypothetical protein
MIIKSFNHDKSRKELKVGKDKDVIDVGVLLDKIDKLQKKIDKLEAKTK